MQNVISGRLVSMDENVLRVQMANGIIASYPYNELNDASAIDLQCIYDNMGQLVVCLIKDGYMTRIKPIGARQEYLHRQR